MVIAIFVFSCLWLVCEIANLVKDGKSNILISIPEFILCLIYMIKFYQGK